jgi:vacuolar-type H+-ATPase catalytic subunit A/Vma1
MDRPSLKNNSSLIIDATIDGYPAIVEGSFGNGKVIINFFNGWSHDNTHPGNAYRANIFQQDNLIYLNEVILDFTTNPTDVSMPNILNVPTNFVLNQNYPNPFNPTTIISHSLPKQSHVKIKIYDILGNLDQEIVNNVQNAGNYNVDFNASNLSSGIYFYKIQAGNFSSIKKMVLLR